MTLINFLTILLFERNYRINTQYSNASSITLTLWFKKKTETSFFQALLTCKHYLGARKILIHTWCQKWNPCLHGKLTRIFLQYSLFIYMFDLQWLGSDLLNVVIPPLCSSRNMHVTITYTSCYYYLITNFRYILCVSNGHI
jgi:hypothetical protein